MASDDPRSLARLATRTEIRQPGAFERLFGGGGGGTGFGGMLAGSLLASVAGTFLGSTIAHSFFDHHPYDEGLSEAGVLDPEPYEDTADADMGDDFDGGDQRRLNPHDRA